MSTREPEITSPVDLCAPDGRALNPAARGWSRHPMHRCNLSGVWGRNKRWDYWAILTDRFAISVTYGDVDYIGLVGVWWVDLNTGEEGGREQIIPLARRVHLPEKPGTQPLRHLGRDLSVIIEDSDAGAQLTVCWCERASVYGKLEAMVSRPPGHESLNVVIPWSEQRFQYTSKHQARPARGALSIGDRRWDFGHPGDLEAWGVLDVGRGRWPYSTRWNWGSGAGKLDDGRSLGVQIGGKWTEGTGFTENGVFLDGKIEKIGDELIWDYDWENPLRPWSIQSPDGELKLRLDPRHDRHDKLELGVLGNEVHQVFGRLSGSYLTESGELLTFENFCGFAEEARFRW